MNIVQHTITFFVKAISKWSFQVSRAVSASPKFSVTKESRCRCLQPSLWSSDDYMLTLHHMYFNNERDLELKNELANTLFFISDHQTEREPERGDGAGRCSWNLILVAVLFWHQRCMAGSDVAPNFSPLQYLHEGKTVGLQYGFPSKFFRSGETGNDKLNPFNFICNYQKGETSLW